MESQKRWPAIVLAVLTAPVILCGRAPAAEGRFERTLKVTGPVELEVVTGSGSIAVRTGGSSEVQVLGTIRARAGMFGHNLESKVRYLESNPPIKQQGNVIEIGHFEDPELQRNISISYDLVVPVNTRMKSATGSGNQQIDGIAGPLQVSSGSGQIQASNLGGDVHASTGSGSIELRSAKGAAMASTGSGSIHATGIAGAFRASTGSGNVHLAQAAPGDVEVGTGSGRIELRNVRGALRAHTASGNITADGEGSGTWKLETASGSVAVRVPSQQGFNLRARTVSGSITTDRPLTVQGTVSRRELRGTVGQGGFLLEVSTVSGNIHIE